MNIRHEDWDEASNGIVQDEAGGLWRIIGFIDRPAVILDPIDTLPLGENGNRRRETVIMGSPHSENWSWLRKEPAAR